ncbi:MAG TPA: hypothetical protein PKW30_08780, partial [Campylobacterales bacterium]|nr:hypothetical protein [Campylobacterales bacterium]
MKFEFLSDRGSRKIVAIAVMIGIFIVGGVMAALFMLRQEAIDTHLKIAQLHARTFSDYFTQTVASIELTHREVSILKAAHSDLTTLRNMLERMPYVRSVSLL